MNTQNSCPTHSAAKELGRTGAVACPPCGFKKEQSEYYLDANLFSMAGQFTTFHQAPR
jgi:hypothetical protein